jgi:hypothetical protein
VVRPRPLILLKSELWRNFSVTEVKERDVQFTRGALYNVGSDSQYGEMEFSLELTLQVTNQFQQFGVPNVPIHWDVKAMSAAEFPDFGSVKFSSPIDESWILDTSNAFNSFNVASTKPSTMFLESDDGKQCRRLSPALSIGSHPLRTQVYFSRFSSWTSTGAPK